TQSHLGAIVESSDDAIISKTLDGIITSWNGGAEKIFGYTSAEAMGQPVSMLIPPEREAEETEILEKLRRDERLDHYETIRVKKDGQRIAISLTDSLIKDANGTIVGISKIARDITHRKQLEEQRERLLDRERVARAKAEEASGLKDEFLATVSHELRTPLTAILGWARILEMGNLAEKDVKQAIAIIDRNARTQAQLIEDLLDVSRII